MFEIFKNVPTPDSRGRPRTSKYPFKDMVVGDCFFVPVKDGQTAERCQMRIVSEARRVGRGLSKRFTSRAMGDKEIYLVANMIEDESIRIKFLADVKMGVISQVVGVWCTEVGVTESRKTGRPRKDHERVPA